MTGATTILAATLALRQSAGDAAAQADGGTPPVASWQRMFAPRNPVSPPPDDPDLMMRQVGPAGTIDLWRMRGRFEESTLTQLLDPKVHGMRWFPKETAEIMPYLAASNQVGGDCLHQGALFDGDPVSNAAQAVKNAFAEYGINYAIWQAYDFSALSHALPGRQRTLNAWGVQVTTRTNIFSSDELTGTNGWLILGANAGIGLGVDANVQTPQTNIGAQGQTLGSLYGDSIYLTQCAWQQSFFDGTLLAMGGMLDPEYVCDLNTYSNNPYNQLLNNEFINQATMPWTCQSLAVVVQWQPIESFYAIWALAQNNLPPGGDAFNMLSWDDMTTMFEFGLIDPEFLGMGRGVLRVLPYGATVDGQGGFGCDFNVEQQLWKDGPLGIFCRAGFGNPDVTIQGGARTQVSGGLVLAGQTDEVFMKSDQAYLAGGVYWMQAADPLALHPQEWGFELTYVFQLTQTVTLQPDLQFVLNPLYNTSASNAAVFTLQVNCTW